MGVRCPMITHFAMATESREKENTMKYYTLRSLLTTLLGGFVLPAVLWATPIFDPDTIDCAGINCSSVRIDGVVRQSFGEVHPWVIEIFAFAGKCLRADVTAQGADLQAVLIAPDGTVYRNDDSGVAPCPLCPLIKVDPTPGLVPTDPFRNRGWYTLQIAPFGGAAVDVNFTLLYGHYPQGNPNCASPTLPTLLPQTAAPEVDKSKKEGPPPPIPGGPSR
jgi:hypothetical protein